MNRFGRESRFAACRTELFRAFRSGALGRAQTALVRDGQVIVVAVCAERALLSLCVNPALYDAHDAGPVDENDPLNSAHYFRVRPRGPSLKPPRA